jgi:hypothetical protein
MFKVSNGQITLDGSPIRLRGWNIGGWLNIEDFINGFVGAEHNLRATMKRILGKEKAQFFFDRMLDHFFTEDDVQAMAKFGAHEIADWEEEMPAGPVSRALKNAADAIDACLTESRLGVQIDRRWFAQYALFGYLAQFLQVPYANLFKEITEERLEDMLSAFELKNCIENKFITAVLEKYLKNQNALKGHKHTDKKANTEIDS